VIREQENQQNNNEIKACSGNGKKFQGENPRQSICQHAVKDREHRG
jgi:hypothetical protein